VLHLLQRPDSRCAKVPTDRLLCRRRARAAKCPAFSAAHAPSEESVPADDLQHAADPARARPARRRAERRARTAASDAQAVHGRRRRRHPRLAAKSPAQPLDRQRAAPAHASDVAACVRHAADERARTAWQWLRTLMRRSQLHALCRTSDESATDPTLLDVLAVLSRAAWKLPDRHRVRARAIGNVVSCRRPRRPCPRSRSSERTAGPRSASFPRRSRRAIVSRARRLAHRLIVSHRPLVAAV